MKASTQQAIDFVESLLSLTGNKILLWRLADSSSQAAGNGNVYETVFGEYGLRLSQDRNSISRISYAEKMNGSVQTTLNVLDASGKGILTLPDVSNLVNLFSMVEHKVAPDQSQQSSIGLLMNLLHQANQLLESSGAAHSA